MKRQLLSSVLLFAPSVAVITMSAGPALAYQVNPKTNSVTLSSLADFDKCQKDYGEYGSDVCLDGLKSFIDKQPKQAFEAGQRARLNFTHWVALSFFAKAFSKKATPEQCANEDVSMAVVSGLALPPDHASLPIAKKLATDKCWEQLRPLLLAELKETSGYYRDNTCPLLAAKGVAAPECQPVAKTEPEKPAPSEVEKALKGVDWKKLTLDQATSRAYRGANGEEISLIRTKGRAPELVLLKIKNTTGPFNDQVLMTLERPGGRGKDFVTWIDGAEWSVLFERDGQYQAFFKGQRDGVTLFPVIIDYGAKKSPKPADIASDFAPAAKGAEPKPKPAK